MQKHVTLLGALFIGYNVIGLVAGTAVVALFSAVSQMVRDPQAAVVLTAFAVSIGTFLIVLSVPGLVAGIGLLRGAGWARVLALIVGAFDLLRIPLGTALGIYTLWVLLQDETIQLFGKRGESAGAA
jgi:hypothetical protein